MNGANCGQCSGAGSIPTFDGKSMPCVWCGGLGKVLGLAPDLKFWAPTDRGQSASRPEKIMNMSEL